ncbi:F28J7.14 protein, putative isoform 1 [Hibiscus syriacus]|uniref:F28J7.14 protein, putative isoform 1 n=1 Tax=Hibiscus syriacus TaxID=106335 RepID=A0A6A3B2D9_HIBSY|nr:F28J7.14 protein, putative isoform 1 [Hibiscus syriacus]
MVLGLNAKNRRGPTVRVEYLIQIQEIKPWPPSQSLRSLRSVLIQWENGERNSGSTKTASPTLGSIVGEGKIEFNESLRSEHFFVERRPVEGATTDRKRSESLMDEEYAEEAEIASFTDDDVSSHSSLTISSSTLESNRSSLPQNKENGSVAVIDGKEVKGENMLASKLNLGRTSVAKSSSTDLSSDFEGFVDARASTFNSYGSNSPLRENVVTPKFHLSSSLLTNEKTQDEIKSNMSSNGCDQCKEDASSGSKASAADDAYDCSLEGYSGYGWQENRHEGQYLEQNGQLNIQSEENVLSQGDHGTNDGKTDRLMNVKSIRASSDLARSNRLLTNNQNGELKEVGVAADAQHGAGSFRSKLSNERKVSKVYPKDTRSAVLDNKVQQLENMIKMLEGELREAAAIEASLYSVVAEHGSSMSKVHAPARRLSRLYLHACKEGSQLRSGSAARSAVSGLALVTKACGNDVPRLTFWLSNCVVLRVIINESIRELKLPLSAGPMERNGGGKGKKPASSPLKWKESSPGRKEKETSSDWDNPFVFISALERVETWIFSRINESVWWQTLTPHMQTVSRKEIDKSLSSGSSKSYGRIRSSSNQDRVNFSLDHWKKAFKDACEKLCPVRAAGHECGCLCLLSKLIMEQCVARLDAAMFNAILRDSADEIPTDPVSDPISDPLVLPIPTGKTSFGAGAQLKNAIGNWSRWLTDLFGIDDDDFVGNENKQDDGDERQTTSVKSFNLLNALSDLMMLPKDMLLSKPIREEVCPAFSATLIKRVLDILSPMSFALIQFQMTCLKPWKLRILLKPGKGLLQTFHVQHLLRFIRHLQQQLLLASLVKLEANLT